MEGRIIKQLLLIAAAFLIFSTIGHSQLPWVLSYFTVPESVTSCPMDKEEPECPELCFIKHPDLSTTSQVQIVTLLLLPIYGFLDNVVLLNVSLTSKFYNLYNTAPRDPPLTFLLPLRAPPIF